MPAHAIIIRPNNVCTLLRRSHIISGVTHKCMFDNTYVAYVCYDDERYIMRMGSTPIWGWS